MAQSIPLKQMIGLSRHKITELDPAANAADLTANNVKPAVIDLGYVFGCHVISLRLFAG